MDIVLTYFDESNEEKVLAIIECKEIRFYHSEDYKNYMPIEEILTYKEMTKNIHTYLLNEFNFERLDYSNMV